MPTRETHRDISRDPREDAEWFRRMPPEARAEMRERWRADKTRYLPRYARVGEWRRRCVLEGLLAVGFPVFCIGSFGPLLAAIPAGIGAGLVWFHAQTGRLTSGGVSMVAVVLACTVGGLWSRAHDAVGFFHTAFAAFLAGLLGAALGLRRELAERERV